MTAGAARVRRATLADLDALAVLFDDYRRFYRQTSDIEGARAFLTDRLRQDQSVVFIAGGAGEPLGFTQLFPSFTSAGMARIYILNDLFVAPEARGRGIATALLNRAAEFGREHGAVRLVLSTAVDNRVAQGVYERAGWERDTAFLTYRLPLTAG